jgi:signal transduction histidine kinase
MIDLSPWERYTSPLSVPSGETIFREGDPGDAIYLIDSGQVAITKDTPGGEPLLLGYRGPGDLLGEIALINRAPRTATMLVTQPTELRVIECDVFWALMRRDSDFQQVVMRTMITNLLAADESRIQATLWERDLQAHLTSLVTEHEEMAEVMQLRQETMRFIVHDLRNPIHLAMTALELINEEPGNTPDTETGRFALLAQGGLTRMLNLVDSLLDVSRLEEGVDSLRLGPVDVGALIEKAAEFSQPLTVASDLTIITDVEDGLPRVPADQNRVERVILNLIDNGLRFTPREGVVTVRAWREADWVWVAIDDTGPGISADQRERIFDRFVQTEAGRKSTGFGLGLAYCRTAVTAHGGTIHAEEGPNGVGTRIVFSLPLNPSLD